MNYYIFILKINSRVLKPENKITENCHHCVWSRLYSSSRLGTLHHLDLAMAHLHTVQKVSSDS